MIVVRSLGLVSMFLRFVGFFLWWLPALPRTRVAWPRLRRTFWRSHRDGLRWPRWPRVKILEVLADQTKRNCERIRTWKGTYVVRVKQYLSRKAVQEEFAREIPQGKVVALWQDTTCTMRFVIDMASGSIYREKETTKMGFFREGSNETVKIPNVGPANGRSIVTTEHYLEFDPKVVWPGFVTVLGFPQARNKRAAFRESPEVVGRSFGEFMDPRTIFGFSDNQKFWDEILALSKAAKGEMGDDLRKKMDELVSIYCATKPGEPWYRVNEVLTGPNSPKSSSIYMTAIWSCVAGFNPVELSLAKDQAGMRPTRRYQWRWELSERSIFACQDKRINLFRGQWKTGD